MRLAVVTPRYGREVGGGAETAARLLAEQLVARRGWSVEVLTTTAIDTAWNDGFDAGREQIDGVAVRRFAIDGRRAGDFDARCARLLPAPLRASAADERAWLEAQGPVSRALIDAVASTDADVVAFHPYLYHPTVVGAAAARVPTLLHAAAHDEQPLALGMYRDLFERVDGLSFWSQAERRLVSERFAVGSSPQAVVGLGVDAGDGDAAAVRAALGLGAAPYLLCLGRVDDGKGAALLARLWREYCARHDDALHLVFAGPVVHRPEAAPRMIVTGEVDEATKWGLLRGATALVSPSAFESFGIVLMEAWAVGVPVLVNARCAVAVDHVREAVGGLEFGDFAGFEVAVERLTAAAGLRERLGARGRAHVVQNYAWDAVLDRYTRLVDEVGRHARDRRLQAAPPIGR